MAWTEKQTLTTFDHRSVASDGVSVFFAQYGGGAKYHVFKYDPVADTVTQISNDASWSGTTPLLASNTGGGLPGPALQCFGGSLYALIYTADGSNNLRVYKYSGSGTAWTSVFQITKAMKCVLYATGSHLIVAMAYPTDFPFTWAYYSTNGTSWSAATVDNVPATIEGVGGTTQIFAFAYGQGHSPVIADHTGHSAGLADPDRRYRWFEWSAGAFNITQSADYLGDSAAWSPTDVWLHDPGNYRRDLYHWYLEGGVWKYVSNLGDAWTTPGGSGATPLYSIGYTDQPGTYNNNFVTMVGGTWSAEETVGSSTLTHAVLLSDGSACLFSQTKIYAAPAPAPPVSAPRFYSGYDTLSLVATTPFTEVEPGALAARGDGQVAIGNGVADEVQRVVVWNGSSFDDLTHNHAVTGTVKRLRWIL